MRSASFPLPRSLAAQLLCTYTAALLLTLGSITAVVWLSSQPDSEVPMQARLQKVAHLIKGGLEFDSSGAPRRVTSLPTDLSWVFHDFAADVKYRILDRSGRVLISSDNEGSALTPAGRPFDATLQQFVLSADVGSLLVRTEPMTHGTQTYYIQAALSKRFLAFAQAVTARIRITDILRLAFVSVVLVTIAVYFTLRRVLKPLRATSAATAQIDARNFSKRLATRNLPSEFLPVVTAFNQTLDRLERGYLVQRAFLADAAHELKTPLALIRAQIDMEGTADRETLLQDIDRMARQVNQLLHLAEASETENYVFGSVDVATVAEDVSDYLRRLAECRKVYVDLRRAPGMPPVQADRGALFMLLKNLLENAIQHSQAGGAVVMTIASDQVSVRDEGPGIAADELPNLFKRFWRGRMRRNEGAGLGLAICEEIAAAHKWELAARSDGGGAEFTLSFIPPARDIGLSPLPGAQQ